MIERSIRKDIVKDFQKKKVIVLLGPRQVGKTTLLTEIQQDYSNVLSLNCDSARDVARINGKGPEELRELLQPYDLATIDEAQRVPNIGLTLKMIGDLKLKTHVMVTGSSSLDLLDQSNESAVGRLLHHYLFPFSIPELMADKGEYEEMGNLEKRMVFGLYPEVVNHPNDAIDTLNELSDSYLYKDLLSYRGVRKPMLVENLVRALALQVGSEVSYNELGNLLGVDKETVENYIRLLEKCFVVFQVGSFSRNMRNEIKKGKKIYFYDNGIRNAAIGNFAPLNSRNDVGALWENLMISERVKHNAYSHSHARMFFWRTQAQSKIDLLEEKDGRLSSFEFKWNSQKKARMPAPFASAYPGSTFEVINPDNFLHFIQVK